MPTRSVHLTDHYDDFIKERVADGRFADASEAVRAGLYLLERQDSEEKAKLAWLRATTQEAFAALDRGEGIHLDGIQDIDAFVDSVVEEELGARASTHD